jgi:hypothetical protein
MTTPDGRGASSPEIVGAIRWDLGNPTKPNMQSDLDSRSMSGTFLDDQNVAGGCFMRNDGRRR